MCCAKSHPARTGRDHAASGAAGTTGLAGSTGHAGTTGAAGTTVPSNYSSDIASLEPSLSATCE
ncbi:MAG TPA: hypothetical protein VFG23_11145 [Polyangia bacterium]|nr:hypothetical protein [Polyangia bacterium]